LDRWRLEGIERSGRTVSATEAGRWLGISSALRQVVNAKKKWVQGWRLKSWFDWCFAILSFVVFLLLEAALIYSYFVFVHVL